MDEYNDGIQFALLGDNDRDTSDVTGVTKYLTFFEQILPILWCLAAAAGNQCSTLVHFVFLLFYSIGMNSTRILSFSLGKWPLLIVLFSSIYSCIFVIADLSIFFMSKSKKFEIPSFLKYFDISIYQKGRKLDSYYELTQYAIPFVCIVYLAVRKSISISWFSRSRTVILGQFIMIIRIVSVTCLSVMCAAVNSKETTFVPILFALTTICISCVNAPFPNFISTLIHILLILSDATFMAFITGNLIEKPVFDFVPRSVVIICTCVHMAISAAIIGVNRGCPNTRIRMCTNTKTHAIISILSPYVMLIISAVFCLFDLSWESLACFTISCATTFFGTKILNGSAKFVFSINVLVVCGQTVAFQITGKKNANTTPLSNFIIYILMSVGNFFTTGKPKEARHHHQQSNNNVEANNANNEAQEQEQSETNNDAQEQSWITELKKYIITLFMFALVILSAVFASTNPFIAYSAPLLIILIIISFSAYNSWMWAILMLVSLASMLLIFSVRLLPGKIHISWLVDSSKYNKNVFSEVWPLTMLFTLAAICRYYYLDPPDVLVSFIKYVFVLIFLCLATVFIENSLFTVLYQVFIIIYLWTPASWNKILTRIIAFIMLAHLVALQAFNYESLRNLIKNSLYIKIFGLSKSNVDIVGPSAILILYIFSSTYASNYSQTEIPLPAWAKAISDNFWAIINKFSFYLFWGSIFFCVAASDGESVIGAIFTVILGLMRIFDIQGKGLSIFLFVIFVLDVLFISSAQLFNVPSNFKKIMGIIGPLCVTPLQKFINILVSLTAFLYTSKVYEFQINEKLVSIGNVLSSVLLSVVQLSLTILAVTEKNAMSIIGSILMLIILLKPKVTKIGARALTIFLTLLLSYTLFFEIITIKKITKWTDYLLLSNVSVYELSMIFLSLISFSLYYEFGSLDVAFGPTFITAYAPTILVMIYSIISLCGTNYMIFVHTILVMVNILMTAYSGQFHVRSLKWCILFSFFAILVKSCRPIPVFSTKTHPIDIILGFNSESNAKWEFIFSLEFLLYCCVEGDQYNEIRNKELRRAEFRKQRSEIIEEIIEINADYTKTYFNHSLDKLKEGFITLSESVEEMGSIQNVQHLSDPVSTFSLEKNEEEKKDKKEEEDKSKKESREEEEEEEEEEDQNETVSLKVIKIILHFLLRCALFVIDNLLKLILYITDINLDEGVCIGLLQKTKELCTLINNKYKLEDVIAIPEGWEDFVSKLPLSFHTQFHLIYSLNKHIITKSNRWKTIYRYVKVGSRQVIPFLLILLCFYYPIEEPNVIGITYFIIAMTFFSFNIESYSGYVITSIVVMMYRTLLHLPGIEASVTEFIGSIEETQRKLKVSNVLSLCPSTSQIIYEFLVFALSIAAQAYSFTHPFQTRRINQHKPMTVAYQEEYNKMTTHQKINTRFNFTSAVKIPLSEIAFVLDILGFLILLISYNTWAHSTSLNSMISGTSSVTVDYVMFLIGHFTLMLVNQISVISQSPISLYITNMLFGILTFVYCLFFIPVRSESNCFKYGTFNFYFFLRITTSLIFSHQLISGFEHLPPHISKGNPLVLYLTNVIILVVPFLFEFINTVKWLASTTSVALFDKLIIEELKMRLVKQRSAITLFPPDSEKKKKTLGVFILIILIALIFVPFLIMMGSSTTSQPNPLKVATLETGILGLPNFYMGTYTTNGKDVLTPERQTDIFKLNDTDLSPFYDNEALYTQYIEFPSITMTNWIMSDPLIDYYMNKLKDEENSTIPFVKVTYEFESTTTKNKVETFSLTNYGNPLNDEQMNQLINALNATKNGEITEPIQLVIPDLFPVFTIVPLDTYASTVVRYKMDGIFTLNISKSIPLWQVETNVSNPDFFPSFIKPGKIVEYIFSQPSFDAIVTSLLSSTGGFLGLYVFIIVTIGQFVRMFVNSFFDDLWIDRMPDTDKILNVILAIEAHRDAGDLEAEYRTSMMLLNAVRSKHNIIKLTGMMEV